MQTNYINILRKDMRDRQLGASYRQGAVKRAIAKRGSVAQPH
jgi:hypothetical protein